MAAYLAAIDVHAVQWAVGRAGGSPLPWGVGVLAVATLCVALYKRSVTRGEAVGIAFVCVAAFAAMPGAPDPHGCDVTRLLEGRERSAARGSLEGKIVHASRGESGSLRLRVRVSAPSCGAVLLTVKHPRHSWPVGRVVRFSSYLRRISNFGNPGEFDWAGWNARRGARVSAYLWNDDALEDLGGGTGPGGWVDSLRIRIDRAAAAAGGEGGSLLRALLVGDRDGLDPDVKEAFRRAGLAHVLAISGLHIGIVATAVVTSVRGLLLLLLPSFAAGHDAYRPAALAAGLAIAGYAVISGGGVSVLRSVTMGELALLALWHGRPGNIPHALAYAAILIAFVLPGVVTEASFQLSFASVAALLVYGRVRATALGPEPSKVRLVVESFGASTAAWYATLPFAAQHFGRVSLLGPLATPLVLPPLTVVLVLGFAACVCAGLRLPVVHLLFRTSGLCAGLLVKFVALVAALPFGSFQVVAPGWGLVALWLVLPAVVFLRGRRRSGFVVVLALTALTIVGSGLHRRYANDRVDLVFVSVGQGDATLIRLPGGAVILVDTGPPGRGRLAILPLLRRLWIRRIDTLVLTHLQSDHWGAAPELLGHVDIGEVWRPRGPCDRDDFVRFESRARRVGIAVRQVDWRTLPVVGGDGGRVWSVRVIGPTRANRECDDNDASVVLRIEFAGHAALLSGDAEAPAERELLDEGVNLHADVLKAGHHGSRTSSTPEFVDAVSPRLALASVGLANRYGFPHERVRALFESRAVRLYRTDLDGAVTVSLSAGGVDVRTAKPR